MTEAVAIDLGTTLLKAGRLGPEGRLSGLASVPAPPLTGADPIREGDAEAYAKAASALLERVRGNLPPGASLGVASQRSTFLLWDRKTGAPITPLVSWQDRRATEWCRRHGDLESLVARRTGLLLSPHYVGPKLASMMEVDPDLRGRMSRGEAVFGTLETFLVWRWTKGRVHRTDLTMAARTLLADPARGAWAEDLLECFGVPRAALPGIEFTAGMAVKLEGEVVLRASLADQASAALALVGEDPGALLVNLGTGGFLLRPTGSALERIPRYLSGPIFADRGRRLFALEGTINGCGSAADRFGAGPTVLPEEDRTPEAFCLPDSAGVGSPHWRPDVPFALSPKARALPPSEIRRVVLEGIVFRVREILEDLCGGRPLERVLVSGGLARDPFVAEALASCLARPVELLEETEATLLGAGRLAAGLPPFANARTAPVPPGKRGSYLESKFERWKSWLRAFLGG